MYWSRLHSAELHLVRRRKNQLWETLMEQFSTIHPAFVTSIVILVHHLLHNHLHTINQFSTIHHHAQLITIIILILIRLFAYILKAKKFAEPLFSVKKNCRKSA